MSLFLNFFAFLSVTSIVGGVLGLYFQYLNPTDAYLIVVLGLMLAPIFLLLVVVVTLAGNLALIRFSIFATLTFFSSILILIGLFYWYQEYRGEKPYLNDISSDLQNPPSFQHKPKTSSTLFFLNILNLGQKKSSDYDSSKAQYQKARYSQIKPQYYSIPAQDLYDIAHGVATKDMSWEIVHEIPSEFHFEAIAKTPHFHLPDDIVVEVNEWEGKTALRIRSRARLGFFDFDVNANRVLNYIREVRRAVSSEMIERGG